jgi:predicted metal-dependent hydrolase
VSFKLITNGEDAPYLRIEGAQVPLLIKRSTRARRLRLKIRYPCAVEVTLPNALSLKKALTFVMEQGPWITQNIQKLAPVIKVAPGNLIPVLGEPHEIIHQPKARGTVWREEGQIFVTGERPHVSRRVKDWSHQQLKILLRQMCDQFAEQLDVSVGRITVRDQKSRWGSCSSKGNLNFSWRLYLMPEYVISYVAAHEVSHLRYMDHSPQFWATVAEICPQMETAKAWLKKNGSSVHMYDTTN